MLQGSGVREARHSAREVKFLIERDTADELVTWARARLDPDPHATGEFGDEYRTTSLYFDTDALDVYHRRGSFQRCKYRIRRYGSSSLVFLERKVRTKDMLTKRRTTVGLDGLVHLRSAERDPRWSGYWFQQRLDVRRLRPTCQVAYRRIARVGLTAHGPMRLTFDREIVARRADGLAFLPDGGVHVLETQVVLEMKFRIEPPAVFRQLTEEFGLEPRPVSKYRLSLETLDRADASHPSARTASVDKVDVIDA